MNNSNNHGFCLARSTYISQISGKKKMLPLSRAAVDSLTSSNLKMNNFGEPDSSHYYIVKGVLSQTILITLQVLYSIYVYAMCVTIYIAHHNVLLCEKLNTLSHSVSWLRYEEIML